LRIKAVSGKVKKARRKTKADDGSGHFVDNDPMVTSGDETRDDDAESNTNREEGSVERHDRSSFVQEDVRNGDRRWTTFWLAIETWLWLLHSKA
jgi:hypothetical protein